MKQFLYENLHMKVHMVSILCETIPIVLHHFPPPTSSAVELIYQGRCRRYVYEDIQLMHALQEFTQKYIKDECKQETTDKLITT